MCTAGTPIPYESLRTYFKSDPASSWGAYVAGCLLVLAHEKGATFPDGISILVASDVPEGGSACARQCWAASAQRPLSALPSLRVPKLRGAFRQLCRSWSCAVTATHEEGSMHKCNAFGVAVNSCMAVCTCLLRTAGKGVSSSAALEVSVMSAVAAAHDIQLGGRELALLCQKVEVSCCCCGRCVRVFGPVQLSPTKIQLVVLLSTLAVHSTHTFCCASCVGPPVLAAEPVCGRSLWCHGPNDGSTGRGGAADCTTVPASRAAGRRADTATGEAGWVTHTSESAWALALFFASCAGASWHNSMLSVNSVWDLATL
jgi:hypothetical protein